MTSLEKLDKRLLQMVLRWSLYFYDHGDWDSYDLAKVMSAFYWFFIGMAIERLLTWYNSPMTYHVWCVIIVGFLFIRRIYHLWQSQTSMRTNSFFEELIELDYGLMQGHRIVILRVVFLQAFINILVLPIAPLFILFLLTALALFILANYSVLVGNAMYYQIQEKQRNWRHLPGL